MPARIVVHPSSPIGCEAADYSQCAPAGRAPRLRAFPATPRYAASSCSLNLDDRLRPGPRSPMATTNGRGRTCGARPRMQPEKLQAVRPVDPLPCRQWKLLKINVSESMLSPSLPMSLHARRSPSGQAHSEPARGTKDWKIAAVKTQSMYCIALRNKFDKTIIGWYDASASNFSTDQRRAKLFLDRVDADLVADQLRRMYPRLAQDIEVTPVQPTALIYSSDRHSRVAMI
jgi:hypothetical protein